jgi:ankyrin repeat protein
MQACIKGHAEICDIILESQPMIIGDVDKYGNNAMHYAILSDNDEICKILFNKGGIEIVV